MKIDIQGKGFALASSPALLEQLAAARRHFAGTPAQATRLLGIDHAADMKLLRVAK